MNKLEDRKSISEVVLEQRQKLDVEPKKLVLLNMERQLNQDFNQLEKISYEEYLKRQNDLNNSDSEIDLQLLQNIRQELKDTSHLDSFNGLFNENYSFRETVTCNYDSHWKIMDDETRNVLFH